MAAAAAATAVKRMMIGMGRRRMYEEMRGCLEDKRRNEVDWRNEGYIQTSIYTSETTRLRMT
jgi:hypothetical protein